MRKSFTTNDLLRIHRVCQEAGIKDCHTFLLNTPDESSADVTSTLVRNEEARQRHWTGKNLCPPRLKNVRTPWSAR